MKTHVRTLWAQRLTTGMLALLDCGLLALGACAVSGSTPTATGTTSTTSTTISSPSGTAATATLTCLIHQKPVSTDVVHTTLTCTVTSAPSDQTSFTITHTTGSANGGRIDGRCHGALHDGTGSCTAMWDQNALYDTLGTVTGTLLPSNQTIGPADPTPAP